MADKPDALTYSFDTLVDAIKTPIEVFGRRYGPTHSCAINTLWDTGAMISVVPPEIVAKLNFPVVDTIEIIGINGASTADIVEVSVRFPNGAILKNLHAAVCKLAVKRYLEWTLLPKWTSPSPTAETRRNSLSPCRLSRTGLTLKTGLAINPPSRNPENDKPLSPLFVSGGGARH